MSQHYNSQDDVVSPLSHVPFTAVEDPSSDSLRNPEESFATKDATENLDDTVDSQNSDVPDTPETPDSTKEAADKGSPGINRPKPVLGKIQAKKRLMAFANKFNVIPKVQKTKPKLTSSSKSRASDSAKVKMKSTSNVKMLIDELNNAKSKIEAALDIQEKREQLEQHSNREINKSKKHSEEKLFAIEEIIREECKKKMESCSPMGVSHRRRQDDNIGKSYRTGRSNTDGGKYSDNRKQKSQDNYSQHSKTSERRQRSRSRDRHDERKSKEGKEKKNSKDRHRPKSQEKEVRNREREEKRNSRENRSRGGRVNEDKKESRIEKKKDESKREHKSEGKKDDKRDVRDENKVSDDKKEHREDSKVEDDKREHRNDDKAQGERKERREESKVQEESKEHKDKSKINEKREYKGESKVKEETKENKDESKARDEKTKENIKENKYEGKTKEDQARNKDLSKIKDDTRKSRSNSRTEDERRKSRSNSRVKDVNRKSRSNSRMRDESKHRKLQNADNICDKNKEKIEIDECSLKKKSWARLRRYLAESATPEDENESLLSQPIKSRNFEDYTRNFENMMMIGDHNSIRSAVIVDGLDGPKSYPPESIRVTKNVKGVPLLYCENPRVSLLLTREQVYQAIPMERRKTMREICDTTRERDPSIESEEDRRQQYWYRKHNKSRSFDKPRRSSTLQHSNKTIWDVEDEYTASLNKPEESEREKMKSIVSLHSNKKSNKRVPTTVPPIDQEEEEEVAVPVIVECKSSKSTVVENTTKPAIGEKLVSEYEQFMKMVSNEAPLSVEECEKSSKICPIDTRSATIHLEFDFGRDFVKSRDTVESSLETGRKRRSSTKRTPSPKHRRLSESSDIVDKKLRRTEETSPVPSDWKDVVIKVERTSDNENTLAKNRPKKRAEKSEKKRESSSDSSESSTSSSTSESESERMKKRRKKKNRKKRKKRRVKKRKITKESSTNTESSSKSSSSDDSSSDDSAERRKRKRNNKRKHKIKRSSRMRKKKRMRKASTESESSSTSIEEIKEKRRKRKSRKSTKIRKTSDSVISISDDVNDDCHIVKSCENLETLEIKVKTEAESDTRNESIETIEKTPESTVSWNKTIEERKITRELIEHVITPDESNASQNHSTNKNNTERESHKFLSEEWENDSIPMPHKILESGETSKSSPRNVTTEISKETTKKCCKESNENLKKSEKSVKEMKNSLEDDDCLGEKRKSNKTTKNNEKNSRRKATKKLKDRTTRSSSSSSTSSGSTSSDSTSSSSGSSSSSASKSSHENFIGDWKKKKKKQLKSQESARESKKVATKRRNKWPDTDFDTLNVPSLTQLEKVGHKNVLADEWEVDSMEDCHEASTSVKSFSKEVTTKKVPKEVRYDRVTDTYIAVTQESTRETRKSHGRLCAMRIWEEEEEEDVREQMLLREEREKQNPATKVKGWESEEECYIGDSMKGMEENIRVNSPLSAMTRDINEMKAITAKDIQACRDNRSEENAIVELDTQKRSRRSRWDISVQTPDSVSEEKIIPVLWEQEEEDYGKWTKNDETTNTIESLLHRIKKEEVQEIMSTPNEENVTDLLWSPEGVKPSIVLKKSFECSSAARERDATLYSPSSPGLSIKSEDAESNTNSGSCNEAVARVSTNKIDDFLDHTSSTRSDALEETFLPLEKSPESLAKSLATNVDTESTKDTLGDWAIVDTPDNKENSDDESYSGETAAMKKLRMDIFAEYAAVKSMKEIAEHVESINETKRVSSDNKSTLKLIPKQLLVRKTNDEIKATRIPSRISTGTLPHVSSNKDETSVEWKNEKSIDKNEYTEETSANDNEVMRSTTPPLLPIQITKIVPENVIIRAKISPIRVRRSNSPIEAITRLEKGENLHSTVETKETADRDRRSKSPTSEQRKRSPTRKEKDKWKSIGSEDRASGSNYRSNSYGTAKDIKDRKRIDERESRSFKSPTKLDNRRRSSPVRTRGRKRSGSPSCGWDRNRSRSPSRSRSWSRSRSRSPKRRDEGSNWDRQKRGSRFSDDRRDKFSRSPSRHLPTSSTKTSSAKRGSSDKRDRDRRNYDDEERRERDRSRERSSYDPLEMLRDADRVNRATRFRVAEEIEKPGWRFEDNAGIRESSETTDIAYANGQVPSLDYEERTYSRNASLERDITEGPLHEVLPRARYTRSRGEERRDRESGWERSRDSPESERYKTSFRRGGRRVSRDKRSRGSRSSPRRSRSPIDRGRYNSRSRSRSWTRSRSISRSRSRTRSRSRSRSRRRSSDRAPRSLDRGRRSRSISPARDRSRNDDTRSKQRQRSVSKERGRRIETIVQTSGMNNSPGNSSAIDSEMLIDENTDNANNNSHFRYPNANQSGADYEYYSSNNLTYPPRIEEATGSPKRLSLDDRLELELGIKKQMRQETGSISNPYNTPGFNARAYTSHSLPGTPITASTGQRNATSSQHGMYNRQHPTVLQVGNVLQVVPADFGTSGTNVRAVLPSNASTSSTSTSNANRVVRVGNVLQVVPTTTIDWSGATPSPSVNERQSGSNTVYSSTIASTSPVSLPITVPLPVPLPVPVPMPATVASTSVTMSPIPLILPVPGVANLPIPISTVVPAATFSKPERPPRAPSAPPISQPVYNYEAILEVRRKEREERKRLRDEKRREKERRKSERVRRRAKRLLGRNGSAINRLLSDDTTTTTTTTTTLESEQIENSEEEATSVSVETTSVAIVDGEEEQEQIPIVVISDNEEVAAEPEEDEEEEEDEEGDVEEDEEEEEEEEAEEEAEEEGTVARTQDIRNDIDTTVIDTVEVEIEAVSIEEYLLPPPPRKGILVPPGFWEDTIANGNTDDVSGLEENEAVDQEEHTITASYEDEEQVAMGDDEEERADNESIAEREDVPGCERLMSIKSRRSKGQWSWSRGKKITKRRRCKKAVQFADGVRPGEGTSPSGGEGDMPSPPPPVPPISNDSIRDIAKRSRSRKSRKKQKRAKPPKTKKKVKVKIIKLKKPRITPLTAMMLEDSDDLDDRSPPPPPPGSPPPPHLWPSYLAAYNATCHPVEPSPSSSSPTPVPAPPPPTPLPLLVPPPPLNYTIQPCSKA